jgi:YggT family protein
MDVILVPLINLIINVIDIYIFVVLAAVVLSWLTAFNVINTRNRFVYLLCDVIYRLTEPPLRKIRGFLPNLGGIDLSPVVLVLLLMALKEVLARIALRIIA